MNIKELLTMNPHELIEERCKLVEIYSKKAERKIELKVNFAEWWRDNRDKFKSDASTNKAFELTEDGLALMKIREAMKAITFQISAIKQLVEEKGFEATNQY